MKLSLHKLLLRGVILLSLSSCNGLFDDLYDESYGLYTIQQSCYQIPLEDIGLKVIGRRLIWLKDDGTYENVRLKDYTKQLREVLG
jgi:hypothetical protein